jgi:hypothetical protein
MGIKETTHRFSLKATLPLSRPKVQKGTLEVDCHLTVSLWFPTACMLHLVMIAKRILICHQSFRWLTRKEKDSLQRASQTTLPPQAPSTAFSKTYVAAPTIEVLPKEAYDGKGPSKDTVDEDRFAPPTSLPTIQLEYRGSDPPSDHPSDQPSDQSSDFRSDIPSDMPSDMPSYTPSAQRRWVLSG